jgi:hypothetical protein
MNGQTDRQMNEWTGGQTDGWMTDRRTDGLQKSSALRRTSVIVKTSLTSKRHRGVFVVFLRLCFGLTVADPSKDSCESVFVVATIKKNSTDFIFKAFPAVNVIKLFYLRC